MSEEDAFWKAIGDSPADALPRLVYADFLEENAGTVKCGACASGYYPGKQYEWAGPDSVWVLCPTCSGSGYVSDGRADLAAALRATIGRVPVQVMSDPFGPLPEWRWFRRDTGMVHGMGDLPPDLFDALSGGELNEGGWCYFYRPHITAEAAIRSLCRAYVASRGRVTA